MGFVSALSKCPAWASAGGKSNAYFAKTSDDRFIVKQLSRTELHSFLSEFGPAYFAYIRKTHLAAVDGMPATCLARLLGVFQVASRVPVGADGGEGNGEGGGGWGGGGSGSGSWVGTPGALAGMAGSLSSLNSVSGRLDNQLDFTGRAWQILPATSQGSI